MLTDLHAGAWDVTEGLGGEMSADLEDSGAWGSREGDSGK